ncbi:unnamed protein product [Dracunculus medinensis]|uniref:UBX domain-containing protein n=1 Tax=Dracunculus medinensis TaxID=318479 RepID=A0A0N4U7E2_DRAME|nr:unnamed protein product [Dracunculus medinensis]
MSMLDQLLEMGFERNLAESALQATNEVGLIEAMDWLYEQQNKAEVKMEEIKANDIAAKTFDGAANEANNEIRGANSSSTPPKALSFKCDTCGKALADDAAVMFHAAKTKHEGYSESTDSVKPLSEEEKNELLAKLHEKLKEARIKKEEFERKEALEKEKRRRLDGRNALKMEEERREKEMRKAIEDRKREKREDEAARKRVLEQIRLDKESRKFADQMKNLSSSSAVERISIPKVDSEFCCLQIRLPDGSVMKEKFKSVETLAAVYTWIEMNRTDEPQHHYPFSLMTPFPRKVYDGEDREAPLKSLGLCPSASMVIVRKNY